MPTARRSWRRVGKAEVDVEVEAKVVEEKPEDEEEKEKKKEEKEEEEEEAEEEEENNCDKIKQPSPGRWGIIYCILLLHYALQSLHYILSSDSIGFVLRVQFELKGMRARKHIQHQFGADGSKHL